MEQRHDLLADVDDQADRLDSVDDAVGRRPLMLDDPIAKWFPAYADKRVQDPVSGRRVPANP